MNGSTCTQCTSDSACPTTDQAPYSCPTGYESDAESVDCVKKDESKTAGFHGYAFPNNNEGNECPIGFECPDVLALPIPCTPGYYSDAVDQQACTICPAGSKCPTVYAVEACDTGYYALEGSVNCYPVPSGMKASSLGAKTHKPEWCDTGFYSALAAVACTECPDGSMCGGDDIVPTTCTSNRMTSRLGEDGCYPYQFTYPSEFTNQASNGYNKVLPDISDSKIVNYVTPGTYNYIGGS